MSTQVDDLKIKLEADAKNASGEIDKLIGQVEKLKSTLKNSGGSKNAFSDYSASAKKSIADVDSYVNKITKDIEKKLSKEFMLSFKTDVDKKAFQNSIRNIASASAKAGKLYAQGDAKGGSSAMNEASHSIKELENIIGQFSKLDIAEIGKPLGDFVAWIRSFQNIAVGKEFFNTNNEGISGHAIGRFTIDKGPTLDSLWPELVDRFPHLFSASSTNQAHDVNAKLKQHEAGGLANEKANREAIQSGAAQTIQEEIGKIFNDMESMFKTASSRMAEIKAEVGNAGKDYAQKGGKFDTVEKAQREIEKLEIQLYKLQSDMQFTDANSTGFERMATRAAIAENRIASLQEHITYLQSADSYDTSNIDAAIAKWREQEQAIEQATNAVEEFDTAEQGASNMASYDNAIQQYQELINEQRVALEGTKEFQAAFSAMSSKLASLRDNPFVKMNIVKPTEDFKQLESEIVKTEKKMTNLEEAMKRGLETNKDFAGTTTYQKMRYDIQQTRDELEGLNAALSEMGNGTHYVDVSKIFQGLKSAVSETISIVQKASAVFLKFLKIVGTPIDAAFHKAVDAVKSFDLANTRLVKSLTRTVRMLTLMITRMALRGVINETKNAFTDLLNFSEKTANSFNKIITAIDYLAHTFAALAAPILNASGIFKGLGNIIDQITDKIVSLINKVNQLLSALLGHSTWIKATKQAKSYKEEVKQTGKEVNKQLQAFDELNNLTTNDGGGNKPTTTGGGGYEELPIDPKYLNMAQWLKDMWNRGDATELGLAIGNWLKNALDSIPWGLIQAKAAKLGGFLATLLGGFFSTPGLAETIGNTIAGAINSGLSLVGEFIKKFPWDTFGTFVGTAIVTAIKNIQWQRFIDACKDLGKGLAKAFNALLDTDAIAWIGYAIGKLLRGAIDFAYELIAGEDGINWEKLGEQLMYGIRAFFNQMNDVDETGLNGWQKLGKTISEAIKGMLTAINKVLGDSEIRRQIGEAVTDLFSSFDYAGIRAKLFELAGNILKLLGTMLKSAAKTGTFWQMLGDIGLIFAVVLGGKLIKGIMSIGTSAISQALGLVLARGIVNGTLGSTVMSAITGFFAKIGAFFSSSAGVISGAFTKLVGFFSSAATAIGGALEGVAAALGTTVGAILGAIGLVIAAIVVWIKNWDEIKEAAALFCERTLEHLQNIAAWFQENLPNFSLLVSTVFEKIKTIVQEKLENVKRIFTIIFTALKIVVQQAMAHIASVIQGKIEFAKNMISTGLNAAKTLIEGASLAIYNIITGNFSALWTQVKSVFSNIYNYVSDIFNKLGTKLSEFGNNVRATFNDSLIGRAINFVTGRANGGILVGGQWKPIQGYAGGGVPKSAEMFVARENGIPEMVGKIGSHTAVANNDQIVASVSDGVYRAVRAAMNGTQSSGNTNVNIELVGDTANLFKAIRKEGNEFQRRTGNPVFA